MPGCIVSATTASFISVENRRRRATPVITSTFENVSDIGVCLGLSLGPPAKASVRSKQGAVSVAFDDYDDEPDAIVDEIWSADERVRSQAGFPTTGSSGAGN